MAVHALPGEVAAGAHSITHGVLGDVFTGEPGGAGANVDLLRQRIILQLLRQVPMPVAVLCAATKELLGLGILTCDVTPELHKMAAAHCAAEAHQQAFFDSTANVVVQTPGHVPAPVPSRFEKDFEQRELLGRGAFGEVWRCRNLVDNHEYAIKVVDFRTGCTACEQQRVLHEAQTCATVDHPNIVRYHAAWVEDTPVTSVDRLTFQNARSLGDLPSPDAVALLHDDCTDAGSEISFRADEAESDGGIVFEDTSHDNPSATSGSEHEHVVSSEPTEDTSEHKLVPQPHLQRQKPPEIHGKLYIQTELCTGETLQTWITRRNTALASSLTAKKECRHFASESVDILQQCAAALAHLHANGCAHRDIKPANIMFASDGTVRLGDFGLAKKLSGAANPPHELDTRLQAKANLQLSKPLPEHTQGAGTPSYASPEQLNQRRYGIETDVYALGVVLAELLCPVQTLMERAVLLENLRNKQVLPTKASSAYPLTSRLVLAMTQPDAALRPTARGLLDAMPAIRAEIAGQCAIESSRAFRNQRRYHQGGRLLHRHSAHHRQFSHRPPASRPRSQRVGTRAMLLYRRAR